MWARVVAKAIAEDEDNEGIQLAGSQHEAINAILDTEALFLE